ncbi:hypothetical protein BWR19_11860 [Halomonas sp. 1513]|nr:DUF3450 domain-containing protein [Halomonas sp. 1513]APX93572.1 hypothetical protein BWR19_11860 [Halomonas sp. 1513]
MRGALLACALGGASAFPALGEDALPEALAERLASEDEQTRARVSELVRLESETRRLTAYSDELARFNDQQRLHLAAAETQRIAAGSTRETLAPLLRRLVEDLDAWVEADLPFLRDERRARVANLERSLVDGDLEAAERLDRVLAAWRAELDYGRELDAWRGMLDERHEVDFLRWGRVGLYYLTPDASDAAVWQAADGEWQRLDDADRRQLRDALRIVREQRAPALLTLPLSQPLHEAQADEEGA